MFYNKLMICDGEWAYKKRGTQMKKFPLTLKLKKKIK